jgi:non-heme Fe2+,alpha-ketoglutarate-dependent halogenase
MLARFANGATIIAAMPLRMRTSAMSKVLTADEIGRFETDGYLSPVPVLTADEVRAFRSRLESFEARFPEHVKKLKTKSHLLCPWIVDLAEQPRVLDVFEDLLGPNLLLSMAWRIKNPDRQTIAGWHQDFAYGGVKPIVIFGALALSECDATAGCLRVVPGSHRWGALPHEDSENSKSILARGQYISVDFDKSNAVDLALRPGEIALINNRVVHCSGPNNGTDRRIMVLVEIVPTHARREDGRDTALLVRGVDDYHHFEEDPRPAAEFSPEAQAAWKHAADIRGKIIFKNSKLAPSEAYGGTRPAT